MWRTPRTKFSGRSNSHHAKLRGGLYAMHARRYAAAQHLAKTRSYEPVLLGGPADAPNPWIPRSERHSLERSDSGVTLGIDLRLLRSRTFTTVLLLCVTSPIFFSLYRTMAFDTITSSNDYAPYLLALVGRGGSLPPAPNVYRILSVIPAIPLFHLSPLLTFSKAPLSDLDALRAMQAMAMLSYGAMVATSLVLQRVALRTLGCSAISSLLVVLATFVAFEFTAPYGDDPMAIATISMLLAVLDRPFVFCALIIPATFVNEKIPALYCALLAGRILGTQPASRRARIELGASVFAMMVYLLVRAAMRMKGREWQLDPTTYVSGVATTLTDTLSLRGLYLNALPCLLLAVAFALARRTYRTDWTLFRRSDVNVVPTMALLALCVNEHLNVGRVVMHGFPFVLPVLARTLDDSGFGRMAPD